MFLETSHSMMVSRWQKIDRNEGMPFLENIYCIKVKDFNVRTYRCIFFYFFLNSSFFVLLNLLGFISSAYNVRKLHIFTRKTKVRIFPPKRCNICWVRWDKMTLVVNARIVERECMYDGLRNDYCKTWDEIYIRMSWIWWLKIDVISRLVVKFMEAARIYAQTICL